MDDNGYVCGGCSWDLLAVQVFDVVNAKLIVCTCIVWYSWLM